MLVIRSATASDIPEVDRLYRAAIRAAMWLPEQARFPMDFAAASAGERVFICRDDKDRLLGFVSVWEPESFIHHLYVDPQHQGCGVGTSLLASLADWLPQPWSLKCVEKNSAALSFYRSRGWRTQSRDQGEHGAYLLLQYNGEH